VGETGWNVKLLPVRVVQRVAAPFSERRRTAAQIDRDVEDLTSNRPHEFSLGELQLVMQPAQHAAAGERVVVLHELNINPGGREFLSVKRLHEEPSVIPEHFRFDEDDSGQFGGQKLHDVLLRIQRAGPCRPDERH
jgi:hypothetical protein